MKLTRIVAALAIASVGQAGTLLTNAGGGNNRTGDGFSLGVQFVVSAPNLVAVGLGFYDVTGGALQESHEVGLWDVTAGNVQVADATVLAGATNGGIPGFLFVPLGSGVSLVNGDTYRLGAYFPATALDHLMDCCQGAAPTSDPDFTSLVGVFTPLNTIGHLSEPTGLAGHAYVGPNLQFNTPEPGTGGLAFAVVGLIGWVRSRLRR